ncbi:MAG: N-acetyltransferase family protein [Bacteroidota bacterium]
MIIEPVQADQLDELLVFARRIFDITFSPTNDPVVMEEYMNEAFTPEQIRREYAEPGSVYLVARDEGTITGYARLRKSDEVNHLLGPSNIELQRFYIDPAAQGSGLAGQMFDQCLDHCGDVEWLWLGVWEHNPRAIRFYEKCGFERFGEHVFRMGNEDQIDLLMRRRLKHLH